jgi:polyhydroxybutyrate depolymerase
MNRKIVLLVVIIALIFPVFSALAEPGCENLTGKIGYFIDKTITSNGLLREYDLYVPLGYNNDEPTPLVFDFHGLHANSELELKYSRMDLLAEEYNFIIVLPQGIKNSWNAGICCGYARNNNIDDVQFVSDLIDEISSEYCINPKRIFATGMSNGGFMSTHLACKLSDRIAAVAPVAGIDLPEDCQSERPVPLLEFHGTHDIVVPFLGRSGFPIPGRARKWPDVWRTIQKWALMNGCSEELIHPYHNGDASCIAFKDCEEQAKVEFCLILGGGHTWPMGGVDICGVYPYLCWLFGQTSKDIYATGRIWEFFAEHPMPECP